MADRDDEDEFDTSGTLERVRDFVRTYQLYLTMGAVGGLALVAIAMSAYALTEARRDMLRVSTDIAQLKVSLDLFSRQIQGAGPGGQSLVDLTNRLLILEESWRAGQGQAAPLPAPGGAVGAAPATEPQAAPGDPGVAASPLEECIPSGTRFLAMQSDSYPVCGTGAKIGLSAIASGSVVLIDGTTIAAGSSGALAGTACMVGVLSAESDGFAGFAELRVTC